MAYTVTFTVAAAKQIGDLDRGLIRRIRVRVESLSETPRPAGAIKLAGQSDLYRIRIGDYRVVYRIDDEGETVVIAIVAHRREVHRDL